MAFEDRGNRTPTRRCGFRPVTEMRYAFSMAKQPAPIGPDPVIEAYKKDTDRTLIRENLKRSVDERFRRLMALQRFAEELRRAGGAIRQR